jgi:hypothetical protein
LIPVPDTRPQIVQVRFHEPGELSQTLRIQPGDQFVMPVGRDAVQIFTGRGLIYEVGGETPRPASSGSATEPDGLELVTLYALLVGIDDYQSVPLSELRGCVNDVTNVGRFLESEIRPEVSQRVLRLTDHGATRAAIIDGIQGHLGRAGPGDVALLWFSGHGASGPGAEESEVDRAVIFPADVRQGGAGGFSSEAISRLLTQVAASGCRLVFVLDTSSGFVPDRATARPGAEYVVLTAGESSAEEVVDGQARGAFSTAVLRAMTALGPLATYRELYAAVLADLETRSTRRHTAQLFPSASDIVDLPVLGGLLAGSPGQALLRWEQGRWVITAGSAHGLRRGDLRLAVHGSLPPREVRIVDVESDRSVVTPLGWEPSRLAQYRMVLTWPGIASTAVRILGGEDRPAAAAVLTSALTHPDDLVPLIQILPQEATGDSTDPSAVLRSGGEVLIRDGIGPLGRTLVVPGPAEAARALRHIARWRQVLNLENPVSGLDSDITLDVIEAFPGEREIPADRDPIPADETGSVRLRYRRGPTGWEPPTIFIRIRNTGNNDVYCALLSLTSAYAVDASLLPGASIRSRSAAAALAGIPAIVTLPAGTTPAPGASAQDWIKLVIAEGPFHTTSFEMPSLGQQSSTMPSPAVEPWAGINELTFIPGPDPSGMGDWGTRQIRLIVEVPGEPAS